MSEADDEHHEAQPTLSSSPVRASSKGRSKGRRSMRRAVVSLCLVDSRYEVIKDVAAAQGFKLVAHDDDKCNIYW